MFAILLSDQMDPFYQNIGSFPTVFFTFFLGLSLLFWLVAILGWIDVDILEIDLAGGKDSIGSDSSFSNSDALAGLVLRFGLNGVPVTIIISIMSLIGWLLCYYAVYLAMFWVPDGFMRYLVGLPILLLSLYLSAIATAQIIKPLRPLFLEPTQSVKHIIGQTAIVKTSTVDSQFGEATIEDGGAGLLLKVRATGGEKFVKSDQVVLVEYLEEEGVYRVVSLKEFLGE